MAAVMMAAVMGRPVAIFAHGTQSHAKLNFKQDEVHEWSVDVTTRLTDLPAGAKIGFGENALSARTCYTVMAQP